MADEQKPIKLSFADRRMLQQLARLSGATPGRVLARLIRDAYGKRAKEIKRRAGFGISVPGTGKKKKRKIRRKAKGLLIAKPPRPSKRPAKKAAAKKAGASGAKKAPAKKVAAQKAVKKAPAKKAPASLRKPPPKPRG